MHEQGRLRPQFYALLQSAITPPTTAPPGGPLTRSLLIVLDEAANIALDDLDTLVPTAAGTGSQLVTILAAPVPDPCPA